MDRRQQEAFESAKKEFLRWLDSLQEPEVDIEPVRVKWDDRLSVWMEQFDDGCWYGMFDEMPEEKGFGYLLWSGSRPLDKDDVSEVDFDRIENEIANKLSDVKEYFRLKLALKYMVKAGFAALMGWENLEQGTQLEFNVVKGDSYSKSLPSFDELMHDLSGVEITKPSMKGVK